jgi:tetratricopeptide (TPR) repeat protein
MASATLPKLTAEQRRAAAGQFERANQVLQTGEFDYGLQLLLNCCAIDPGNLIYRKALRQAQRAKYQNNEHGQSMAYVRSLMTRMRLKKAMMREAYLDALLQCEAIFMRNPWDLATHLTMANAFEGLELPDHALWTLEQIRPQHANNATVNRPLARLYEKRGNFNRAIALWELVRKAEPDDKEAAHKSKDLAASATIAKGRYEETLRGETSSPASAVEEETASAPALEQTEPSVPVVEDRHPREVANLLEKIKQNPKNANGYLHLARHYRKAEQPDKARAILEEGLPATGNHFEITQELFDLDIDGLRQDLAVTEERLRKKPSDKELQQIREKLTKEINTRELEMYRRRSDRFPTDTAARFEIGLRLLRVGQIDPRYHGKALFYLGMCFQSRKNWRLAQRNFEEALQQLGPNETLLRKETMYLLAVGYANAGEINRAVDLGCELANLDFNYKNIGTLIDEWQTKAAK